MLAKKGEFMAGSTLFHNMPCVYITGRAVFFINVLIEALYANAPKLVVPFADIALGYIIKRYSKKVKIHFNLKSSTEHQDRRLHLWGGGKLGELALTGMVSHEITLFAYSP